MAQPEVQKPLEFPVREDLLTEGFVQEQVRIVQEALTRAEIAYRGLLMDGQTIKEDFHDALKSAAENFTPQQEEILEGRANPKANTMWRQDFHLDQEGKSDMSGFLVMCFSDGCAPLLQASYLMSPENTSPEKINDAIEIGTLTATAFPAMAENYTLFLEGTEFSSTMKELAGVFGVAAEDISKATQALANISEEQMQENGRKLLETSNSMAYLKPIAPTAWNGISLVA